MTRAARHNDWPAPEASLNEAGGTIKIRPAPSATYIPSKWTFELDHEAVLQRLISDVYSQPRAFIRELLQNALDANRSQMYADLVEEGLEAPEYPTQVDEERRSRYSVKISLGTKEIENPLSGETEQRQVLTVEDRGIGMDKEIIQRYFLQVGRSYYTTDEFRRNFRFIPTSRFGLGFLSVFAVSDHVTVETLKPSSPNQDGPLRLTLTGPRSYLLTDRGKRRLSGTRIEVLLREQIEPGELTQVVSQWCRRVEFPIYVDDHGTLTTVNRERPEQFTYEIPIVTEEGASFAVRAFPTNHHGIDGELYIFALIDDKGESWAAWDWANSTYPRKHPGASAPAFPSDLICLHGIAMRTSEPNFIRSPMSARLDYRGESRRPALSRETSWRRSENNQEIESRWEEILRDHLATSPRAKSEEGWKYKQRLVKYFPLHSFWASYPETIRVHIKGEQRLTSLNELLTTQELATIMPVYQFRLSAVEFYTYEPSETEISTPEWYDDSIAIIEEDLELLSDEHRSAVFEDRSVGSVEWSHEGDLILHWILNKKSNLLSRHAWQPLEVTNLPTSTVVGFSVHKTTDNTYGHGLLNEGHPFVQWLIRVRDCCAQDAHGLRKEQFDSLISLLETPLRYRGHKLSQLTRYLDEWQNLPGLPSELYPPAVELTPDMFIMKKEGDGDSSKQD